MSKVKQTKRSGMVYCGDRNRGCGASLTEADLEAGHCTQCGEPLVPEAFPLEHALLLSLREVESRRKADE